MPHKTTDELLKAKLERATRLKAQIAGLQQRKRTEDRRRDTRRTFVVGNAVLAHAEADPVFREALCAVLRAAVTRAGDKALVADLVGD